MFVTKNYMEVLVKKIFTLLIIIFLITGFVSCKYFQKVKDTNNTTEVVEKTTNKVTSVPTKQDEMIAIFEGFEEIVIKYKNDPESGIKACQAYVENNLEKIKTIEKEIMNMSKGPAQIKYFIEINDRIKKIGDRITAIATESYGVASVDVIMLLSDMVLARLDGDM